MTAKRLYSLMVPGKEVASDRLPRPIFVAVVHAWHLAVPARSDFVDAIDLKVLVVITNTV